ncbi:hypothetical protein Tco_0858315, partial [Tanacetum coccineum]
MTTTTPLLPPPQQQSITESELAECVAALEKKLSDLEHTNKNLDNTTQNLRSRDLPEEDMKEMLHQRMFKSGTYKSLPEHIALYEALEVSMARARRDEFLAEKDKSRKRRHDDQDSPPPLPDSDLNAPSSSSKKQSGPYDEQPFEDILFLDSANISDSEDTGSAHLPYVKPRPEWLKLIPEDDKPAPPEPAWVILTSHVPRAKQRPIALATTRWERPSLLKQVLKVKLMKSLKLSTQMLFILSSRWKRVTRCLQIRLTGLIQKVINKGSGQALSISKMKVACYHDFGLELLVPEHMWIDDVCTYDLSASYGISHWWFNRQNSTLTETQLNQAA